jgi:hypothetical protein
MFDDRVLSGLDMAFKPVGRHDILHMMIPQNADAAHRHRRIAGLLEASIDLSASRAARHFAADSNVISVRAPTFISRGPSPCFFSL